MTSVIVSNPLPAALAYYESTLIGHLRRSGFAVEADEATAIEGLSKRTRLAAAAKELNRRARLASENARLVLWPTFGYFDALTWLRASRRSTVTLVIHDVDPLRSQFGYSRLATRSFAVALQSDRIRAVTHTRDAADRLASLTGAKATVIPHPVSASAARVLPRRNGSRALVLGQFKPARSLGALEQLAASKLPGIELRAVGRGWPELSGWDVVDGFVSEEKFAAELASADVLVLPYDRYQQSGVLVRAFELGIPVVGLPHPQLQELYGDHWPGIVRDGRWHEALVRSLSAPRPDLISKRNELVSSIDNAWLTYLRSDQ